MFSFGVCELSGNIQQPPIDLKSTWALEVCSLSYCLAERYAQEIYLNDMLLTCRILTPLRWVHLQSHSVYRFDSGSLKRKVQGVAKDLEKQALTPAEEGSTGKRLKPHHDARTADNGFAKEAVDATSENTGSQDEVTPFMVLYL